MSMFIAETLNFSQPPIELNFLDFDLQLRKTLEDQKEIWLWQITRFDEDYASGCDVDMQDAEANCVRDFCINIKRDAPDVDDHQIDDLWNEIRLDYQERTEATCSTNSGHH